MIFIHLRQHHISCQKILQQYTCLGNRTTKVICAVLSLQLPDGTQWLIMKLHGFYAIHLSSKRRDRLGFFSQSLLFVRMKLMLPKHGRIHLTSPFPCIFSSLMRHVVHSLKAVFLNHENFKRCRLQVCRIPQPVEES